MKKTLLSIPILLSILFAGCQNQEDIALDPNGTKSSHMCANIDEQKACALAEFYQNKLFPRTRSGELKIKSVEKSYGLSTRSTNTDNPSWYIINYEDGGYTAISGDNRISSLLAISQTGQLSMSDTIENKGLASFFAYIRGAQKVAKEENVSPISTYGFEIEPKPEPDTLFGKIETMYEIKPLLSETIQKWGQGAPLNKYCFTTNFSITGAGQKQAVTGCVPLACAMVMSHYGMPITKDGYMFDWPRIRSGKDTDSAARLIWLLGQPKYLNATYGEFGTSVTPSRIPGTFVNFGYKTPLHTSFNNEYTHLSYGPLLISGYPNEVDNGHRWVIDGCNIYRMNLGNQGAIIGPSGDDRVQYEYHYLYHCVWGNYGFDNGYYNWNVTSNKFQDDNGRPIKYPVSLSYYYNFR